MNKYLAKKKVVNGREFHSIKEANRYATLLLLEKSGRISNLKCQPKYLLQDSFKKNGKTYRKIEYIADFEYIDNQTGELVVEDVKSAFTEKDKVFAIKRKMFEKKYEDKTISIVR